MTPQGTELGPISPSAAAEALARVDDHISRAHEVTQKLVHTIDVPRDPESGLPYGPIETPTIVDAEAVMSLLLLVKRAREYMSNIEQELQTIEAVAIQSYEDFQSYSGGRSR